MQKISNTLSLHVDFDSTLFNTRRFADDLCRDIAGQAQVPFERVKADTQRHHKDPDLKHYDFERHVAIYGLDPRVMWQRLDAIVRSGDYLFEDSAAFIQGLRAAGFEPRILTFGEASIQRAKILPNLAALAGGDKAYAAHPLEVEITLRKKGEFLAEAYPGQRGALVDDVPDQQLPPGFTEIHLDRPRGLTAPEAKSGGFTVSNLEQARQVIESLRETAA